MKQKDTQKNRLGYNTKMSEIEKSEEINLNLKKDISLGEYLKKRGFSSLADMLAK